MINHMAWDWRKQQRIQHVVWLKGARNVRFDVQQQKFSVYHFVLERSVFKVQL